MQYLVYVCLPTYMNGQKRLYSFTKIQKSTLCCRFAEPNSKYYYLVLYLPILVFLDVEKFEYSY